MKERSRKETDVVTDNRENMNKSKCGSMKELIN